MSATTLRRLRYTPLQDLILGRMTGRLDVRMTIDSAGLPESLRTIVSKTVRRTRLWRSERVDVARELIAHFRDGLEAHIDSDELIRRFGDPKHTAKLIRRARKRTRPVAWRMSMRLAQVSGLMMALLLVVYAVIAIRTFTAAPTISVDYLAQLNAPAATVSDNDRAWPVYREAINALPDAPRVSATPWPGIPEWPEVVRYLESNAPILDRIRAAARKPAMGYVLQPIADTNSLGLHGAGLEHLWPMRELVRVLSADAKRAAEAGDAATFIADIETLLGVSRQGRTPAFLISELVSMSLAVTAHQEVIEAVTLWPETFTDEDLRRLSQVVANASVMDVSAALAAERAGFLDLVQRIYTDDGHGDGRITAVGIRMLHVYGGEGEIDVPADALIPVMAGVVINRREAVALYDEIFAVCQAELAKPTWLRLGDPSDEILEDLRDSPMDRVRYAPVTVCMPAVFRAAQNFERADDLRDAATAVIAMELFRRQEGRWPVELEDLVPELLPRVPIDRRTGDPVIYEVVDGVVMLRSVGLDQTDDGGHRMRDEVYLPIAAPSPLPEVPYTYPAWKTGWNIQEGDGS